MVRVTDLIFDEAMASKFPNNTGKRSRSDVIMLDDDEDSTSKRRDLDFSEQLAMRLQQEEYDASVSSSATPVPPRSQPSAAAADPDAAILSVTDFPDAHQLFQFYNDTYFQSTLSGCEVRWSKRMTLCAGVCSYEGRGGLCSIRLSEALLKYRPVSDMINTLLHEMIHAYLFVASNERDRESHGPVFQSHMHRYVVPENVNVLLTRIHLGFCCWIEMHCRICDICPSVGASESTKQLVRILPSTIHSTMKWHRIARTCGGVRAHVSSDLPILVSFNEQ